MNKTLPMPCGKHVFFMSLKKNIIQYEGYEFTDKQWNIYPRDLKMSISNHSPPVSCLEDPLAFYYDS